jgi:oxygen-independent coproporphyrinogen-3 oxidase
LRFEQAERGYERLIAAGYQPIGFDHFARPEDPLAAAVGEGRVNRNFQGFTDDDASVLLGFGASAISKFPDLIVQNEKRAGHYRDLIGNGRPTATRGVMIDANERKRGAIIRDLLCSGRARIDASFSKAARAAMDGYEDRGLIDWEGDELVIRECGRPYARHVAAHFDRVRGKL